MGIDVALTDEAGVKIEEFFDPHRILPRLLPEISDASYECVKYIDDNGDTLFNKFQMGPLLRDLTRLYDRATTQEERDMLDRVRSLAEQCQRGVHLYLRFHGD